MFFFFAVVGFPRRGFRPELNLLAVPFLSRGVDVFDSVFRSGQAADSDDDMFGVGAPLGADGDDEQGEEDDGEGPEGEGPKAKGTGSGDVFNLRGMHGDDSSKSKIPGMKVGLHVAARACVWFPGAIFCFA